VNKPVTLDSAWFGIRRSAFGAWRFYRVRNLLSRPRNYCREVFKLEVD